MRWNEGAGRWMAWVRFPDGARRKVERVDKAAAQQDLDELLTLRAQALEPGPRRQRLASFAEVLDAWLEAGCPLGSPTTTSRHAREKSPNTISNARRRARRKPADPSPSGRHNACWSTPSRSTPGRPCG